MIIEKWEMSPDLKKELDTHYKTKYALSLAGNEPMDIARALTFDNLAPTVTSAELLKLLNELNIHFVRGGIRGVGLEIGSGPGTFVAALATLPHVERVYGVEACEAIVEELMTKVVTYIAPQQSDKVVGAVASFDTIVLPDNSVDFIFDFFSLHHSPNPDVTLKELARVLKKGGVMLCLDKARANSLSESDLETLLNIEYNENTKIEMGLPREKVHTRRMNGEHEYRLKDWNTYFTGAGFLDITHYNVAKIGGSMPVRIIKQFLSLLPICIQSKISGFISRKITNNLEPSHRIFKNIFPSYPREFSLMIAWKK